MTIFVDTNVLLDVIARRDPHYAAASRIWTLAESGDVSAHISVISFNNIYYIVRKAAGKTKANEALHLLRKVFEVEFIDRRILDRAIDSGMADFEDALQYWSAVGVGARCLITRNPSHFPDEGPTVLSSEEFLAAFSQQPDEPPDRG